MYSTLLAQYHAPTLNKCDLILLATRNGALISPSTYFNLAFFQEYKGCSGLQPYSEMTLQVSLTPWAAFSDLHL